LNLTTQRADPLQFKAIASQEIYEVSARELSPENWMDLIVSTQGALQVMCNQQLEI